MFKSKKQKIKEECYDLNYSFIEWLNTRLKVYKSDAIKTIDLTYHKIMYNNTEYSLLELIDMMIDITDYLMLDKHYYDYSKETDEQTNKLLDIFKITFNYLWW